MLTSTQVPLPPELAALRPRTSYLLCATPRSGSTLLCDLLQATGIAGRPEEYFEALRGTGRPRQPREYFEGVDDPDVIDLLPRSEPPVGVDVPFLERLGAVVRQATTPNGVFGAKVMWGYYDDLQARLAQLPALSALDAAARLERVLGDVRYVHVRRRDVVAQAVSLWRAVQTRAWRADEDGAAREPAYAFAGIDHLVRMLRSHDDRWRRWFAARAIAPLGLSYEDIAADPPAVVMRTLDHVGIASELTDSVPAPRLRRQADDVSREWVERYRREAAAG
jgi:LPS sulfotransferase NodH